MVMEISVCEMSRLKIFTSTNLQPRNSLIEQWPRKWGAGLTIQGNCAQHRLIAP